MPWGVFRFGGVFARVVDRERFSKRPLDAEVVNTAAPCVLPENVCRIARGRAMAPIRLPPIGVLRAVCFSRALAKRSELMRLADVTHRERCPGRRAQTRLCRPMEEESLAPPDRPLNGTRMRSCSSSEPLARSVAAVPLERLRSLQHRPQGIDAAGAVVVVVAGFAFLLAFLGLCGSRSTR